MHISTSEDLHARLDRLEQELRHVRAPDRTIIQDDSDRPHTISSLAGFQMPDIERFTGVGCP